MSEIVLGSYVGSHHGHPDLFERDIQLLQHYQKWLETAKATGLSHYQNWTPSYVDMLKSRLFWRIRSGKDPLPEAPPTAYSCPWYELIEVPGPHDIWEEIRVYGPNQGFPKKFCSVAQCSYQVIEDHAPAGQCIPCGGSNPEPCASVYLTLKYNCYLFKAWNGMVPTRKVITDPVSGEQKAVDSERPGGWIEYIGSI
jgi:hypothetical protein